MRIARWFSGKGAASPASGEGGGEAVGVLFVCMGNICRSPTAEGVFRIALERAGLAGRVRTASAGLGNWHVGQPPDPRAIRAARRRGYDLTALRGRQVESADFAKFGWILGMDDSNLRALTDMKPPEFAGHLGLLLDLAPELGVREVPDPYFGGPDGFDRVLDLVEASTAGLVARLQPLLKADET
jgi:protein-tyrosine phosphatase